MLKKLIMFFICFYSFLFCFLPSISQATSAVKDPYEPYNRVMFNFNRDIDLLIMTPVASMYKTFLPNIAQEGIHNAFNNLDSVPVIINDALQFKVYQFAQDTWRLFFNTTFGILGLFDVASKIGLPSHDNDFGMTLATWGYKNSNYFIIPFFGSSTIRDAIGFGVDSQFFTVYSYLDEVSLRNYLLALDFIQNRADKLQYQPLIDQAALDQYIFMRDAYMQRRTHVINRNNSKDPNDNGYSNDDPFLSQ